MWAPHPQFYALPASAGAAWGMEAPCLAPPRKALSELPLILVIRIKFQLFQLTPLASAPASEGKGAGKGAGEFPLC